MRILVTGATGFIGRRLVSRLVQAGETVTILVRDHGPDHKRPPWPPEIGQLRTAIDVVYGDLRNFRLTARAVKQAQPERVIHLAAAGVGQPFLPAETALRHNLYGTLHLARACFDTGEAPVKQLLVGRTPGECTAMNSYAASKAAAWQFCRMYSRTQDWPINGAMIFQCYGPSQPAHNLIPAALTAAQAGLDFPMTSGRATRDWIFVDDVVSGLQAAAYSHLEPGATVELGTGQLRTVAEVVRQIYTLAGRGGQPLVGYLPDRPGEEQEQSADVRRTTKLTGWTATTALADGLNRLLVCDQ